MGVHGLTGWMRSCPQVFSEQIRLFQGSKVVIDAKGLAYYLYTTETNPDALPPLDFLYGGEYAGLYQRVVDFLENLRHAGIVPLFVVDGLPDPKKSATSQSRDEDTRADLHELDCLLQRNEAPLSQIIPEFGNHKFVKPPFLLATVLEALRDASAYIYRSDGEADALIAALTYRPYWNQMIEFLDSIDDNVSRRNSAIEETQQPIYVVSNDSDFVIFDIPGVIPFAELFVSREGNLVSATVFQARKLAAVMRVPVSFLPTFACLVGNDFMPSKTWLHSQLTTYVETHLQGGRINKKKKKRKRAGAGAGSQSREKINPHYVIEAVAHVLRSAGKDLDQDDRVTALKPSHLTAMDIELMVALFASMDSGKSIHAQQELVNSVYGRHTKKRKGGNELTEIDYSRRRRILEAIVQERLATRDLLLESTICFVCLNYHGKDFGLNAVKPKRQGCLSSISEAAFRTLCTLFCELNGARSMYDKTGGQLNCLYSPIRGQIDSLFFSGAMVSETYLQLKENVTVLPLSLLGKAEEHVHTLCGIISYIRDSNWMSAASRFNFHVGYERYTGTFRETEKILGDKFEKLLQMTNVQQPSSEIEDLKKTFPKISNPGIPSDLLPTLLVFVLTYLLFNFYRHSDVAVNEASIIAQGCALIRRSDASKSLTKLQTVLHSTLDRLSMRFLNVSSMLIQSVAVSLRTIFPKGNGAPCHCLKHYNSSVARPIFETLLKIQKEDGITLNFLNEDHINRIGEKLGLDGFELEFFYSARSCLMFLVGENEK